MRFGKLEIPAYGPFTEFTLDLPRGATDFHLIYGPNEAGKSSLLRAIRALLFGIPGQTDDNFQHDYKKLLIRGELEDASGASRIFQRRKGNRNTLLGEDGNPADEAELKRLLGAVDEAYFDSMFGLGSEQLRQGADELLRGEGRLGEALFSASLGGTPVDRVIQALEDEAGELFAGRAQRRIRLVAREYDEQVRAKKEALIKPEAWEEVEHALAEADRQLENLKQQRTEHANRKAWLERCQSALPMVGQLAERRAKLEELPELPDLPATFAEEIRSARNAWTNASRDAERLAGDLERLKARSDECQLRPEVLAWEAEIDALHTGLGAYRENRQVLDAKQGDARAREAAVRRECRDLGLTVPLEDLETLRITRPRFSEAEDKASALEEAERAHQQALDQEKDLEKNLERLRAAPTKADPEAHAALKDLLAGVSTIETVASDLPSRRSALERLERTLRGHHASLGGAPDALDQTPALNPPSGATIERFRQDFSDADRQVADLAKDRRKTENEIREIEAEIDRRARQGALPGLDDLNASRAHRERGWALVLKDWKGGGADEPFVEGTPLDEAYPEAVHAADAIADRLRTDAAAVAQLEELRSRLELERENLASIQARAEKAGNAAARVRTDWAKAWEEVHPEPASPSEMSAWRETWVEFGRAWDQWTEDRQQLAADEQRVDQMAARLAKALNSESTDFEELLGRARERFEELDDARDEALGTESRISVAESELESLRDQLPELKTAVASARKEWEHCREDLSLSQDLSPASQIESLRARREMFQDFDAWRGLLAECDTLQERIGAYEKKVEDAVSRLGISDEGTEAREKALWTALVAARKAQATHEEVQDRLTELADDRQAAQEEVTRTRADFDALLAQTKLDDETGLDPLLDQLEEQRSLREKIEESRDGLAGLSLGMPVDDFVAKVTEEDADTLASSIGELAEAVEDLEARIDEVKAERQDWDRQRREMEQARDEAARHEQEAAFAISRMESDAERFVRLRVAIQLLREQIDTFRQRNQGPFVEKAGRWFSEVTGGAFLGIGTSFGDGDEPVIAGLRADGEDEVLVRGMSEGTRDQLYFALRLAGLELHLEDHEPMPMILDDLLVHFDDERATHALRTIASLAARSQVLLFTHHAHVVELARVHVSSDHFKLHEIG